MLNGIALTQDDGILTLTNGLIALCIRLASGLCTWSSPHLPACMDGATCAANLGPDGLHEAGSFTSHALLQGQSQDVNDGLGKGKRIVIRHSTDAGLSLDQVFVIYENRPFILTEIEVNGTKDLASNWLAPVVLHPGGSASPGPGPEPFLLDAPFDNDEWARFDNRSLVKKDGPVSGVSHGFTCIYENASRNGIVIGSVTHDFWKTGIAYEAGSRDNGVDSLTVFGGVTTPDSQTYTDPTYGRDGTHDRCTHGAMKGRRLVSPRIFVGIYEDFREGLEDYGLVNAAVAPPLPWNRGVPVGWMSWGAFGFDFQVDHVRKVSDFAAKELKSRGFQGRGGEFYVNLDAYVLNDDQLCQAAECIRANKLLPGFYLSPFIYWHHDRLADPLKEAVPGTAYCYGDIVLRDRDGRPISHKPGSYALDVTHPGTRHRIRQTVQKALTMGYEYFKLDFLTEGTLEGVHHDPDIATGMQAYHQAMRYVSELIGPDKFISLSIAPIFPHQYGHSRRVCCDTFNHLNDVLGDGYPHYGSTEYLLNALSNAWWMGSTLYAFNDPDAVTMVRFQKQKEIPEQWARTRVLATIVSSGNYLDTSGYMDEVAAARAKKLLTNGGLNDLLLKGVRFRPVECAPGRYAADSRSFHKQGVYLFMAKHDGNTYLAGFNCHATQDCQPGVPLERLGLDAAAPCHATDLWTGADCPVDQGTVRLVLPGGGAQILRLAPHHP